MRKDEIKELISRRRRQLLVHSCIYYRLNDSIINDYQYDEWCRELIDLQTEYPDIAKECPHDDAFHDFEMGASFQLPHYRALGLAEQLIVHHRKENE